MEKSTVCCINHGDYLGCGDRYVSALRMALYRNSDLPIFDFDEIDLPEGAVGWWNKIALFEPGRFQRGQHVLYLDLDTIICGDISAIAAYTGPFAMLRDFYHPGKMASGVMAWTVSEKTEAIWTNWVAKEKPQFDPRGDQGWISYMMPDAEILQDLYPGQIVSFKGDCIEGIPTGANIVCFHGLPRPHTLKDTLEHWK